MFLFYVESGTIFSGRILEKTIRETIDRGLNTEYFLEVYAADGEDIDIKKIKFDDKVCKIFSDIEELRIELHDHVMTAVNLMIDDCSEIYNRVNRVTNS